MISILFWCFDFQQGDHFLVFAPQLSYFFPSIPLYAFHYFLQVVYTLRGRIPYMYLQVIPLWAYIFTSSTYSLHFPPYVLQSFVFWRNQGGDCEESLVWDVIQLFHFMHLISRGSLAFKILQGFYYQGGVLVICPRGRVALSLSSLRFLQLIG